ncbi:hypothetical protein TRICI_002236 [Trichomonascus ciferrii]|uniref:HECT-type E3 ubiquitin transferase n=1 Tax=Trichomonascus ciferrii TaxID=44093 RepID=A0A642VBV4_9ASCO|nr:hypothetical protein TRICI_002236 [Trichomonascus ciferrii]
MDPSILTQNLRQLLDYDGDDFEDVFGLNFCVSIKDQQGNVIEESLIVNGEDTPVTKANRQDYIRRVMTYFLDTSVRRQFEPFKQGFYNVVGGNALTLFRPEEIELLLRGSPEPVDVDALQSVTKYQNFVVNNVLVVNRSFTVTELWTSCSFVL